MTNDLTLAAACLRHGRLVRVNRVLRLLRPPQHGVLVQLGRCVLAGGLRQQLHRLHRVARLYGLSAHAHRLRADGGAHHAVAAAGVRLHAGLEDSQVLNLHRVAVERQLADALHHVREDAADGALYVG